MSELTEALGIIVFVVLIFLVGIFVGYEFELSHCKIADQAAVTQAQASVISKQLKENNSINQTESNYDAEIKDAIAKWSDANSVQQSTNARGLLANGKSTKSIDATPCDNSRH
jgi:uncharacterized protein YneF (UPF0154 family)